MTGAASAALPLSRLLRAAGAYFLIVFAVGFTLGPVRVLWIEPLVGRTFAVLLETPLLALAMWFGARWARHWARLEGGWGALLAMGVIALLLQQIADLAVGFGLRGMTLAEQWALFGTPAGAVYAVSLALFALMPLIRESIEQGRRT